jgi:hypothetical protein
LSCHLPHTVLEERYPFFRHVYLLLGTGDTADWRRLNNLGYADEALEDKVRAYQEDFCRPITGVLADIAEEMRAWHDGGPTPAKGSIKDSPMNGPYEPSTDSEDDPPGFGSDDEGVVDS